MYPANLFFIIEGKKYLHNKLKPKVFMTTIPTLQKVLKVILYREEDDKHNTRKKKKPNKSQ
jgi:hypothetical protein